MKSGPVYNPTLGSLAEIIVRPDTVIPMGAVKFPPPSFAHCHTSESEINISFDVYGDRFGLEYWLGLMEKYQLTPEAVSDLLEICDSISQDNPEAADRVEDGFAGLRPSCQFSIGWSRKERSDSPASPLLGGATVFDLLSRLRP
jgi:hypothetical protein